ncbi:hypothetical protein ACO0K7_10170 [Undibacterium sp. Ji67W]|uniref:hypothetical protein n=1 Tax=Undibacterium sp. Ji67W TaxID=3413042 RepID=UPI003BF367B4
MKIDETKLKIVLAVARERLKDDDRTDRLLEERDKLSLIARQAHTAEKIALEEAIKKTQHEFENTLKVKEIQAEKDRRHLEETQQRLEMERKENEIKTETTKQLLNSNNSLSQTLAALTKPKDKSKNELLEQRIKAIEDALKALGFDDLMKIPVGGKTKAMERCINPECKLFRASENIFNKVWQAGLEKSRFKMKNHEIYASGRVG